jgi:hypothetical protein
MTATPTPRRRTIGMSEIRSRQIALCAAYVGVSAEKWIQSSVTAAMISLADNDKALAYMLVRAGGTEWDSLARAADADDDLSYRSACFPSC